MPDSSMHQKSTLTHHLVPSLLEQFETADWQERMCMFGKFNTLNSVFSTSFSPEDQLITHAIAENNLPITLFTLDTGRLFEQTYKLHQQTCKQYGLKIHTYYPNAESVQNFVNTRGINSFYDTQKDRLRCCHIRKVEPLSRALKGVNLWISGLRQEHSEHRSTLKPVVWDDHYQLIKCYPLLDMTTEHVWQQIEELNIPYNPMYKNGFPSIGCEPCTRAIKAGEPIRSGRWWWEQSGKQECGLHFSAGKLVRKGEKSHAE